MNPPIITHHEVCTWSTHLHILLIFKFINSLLLQVMACYISFERARQYLSNDTGFIEFYSPGPKLWLVEGTYLRFSIGKIAKIGTLPQLTGYIVITVFH